MQPGGSTLRKQQENRQRWEAWLRRAERRPEVREFAVNLVALIEDRVGSPASQHVAQLAEQAMSEAGRDRLSQRQVREVLMLLRDVWKHGPSLRNWASRQGLMN